MQKLATSKVIAVAVAILAVYFACVWLFGAGPVINILNGVFIGILVAVSFVYAPLVWASIRGRRFTRVPQFALGIGCIWGSIGLGRIYSFWWRNSNKDPQQLLNDPVIGLVVLLAIVGGVLFVTAPGYEAEEYFTQRFGGDNRWLLLFALLAGAAGALAVGLWEG